LIADEPGETADMAAVAAFADEPADATSDEVVGESAQQVVETRLEADANDVNPQQFAPVAPDIDETADPTLSNDVSAPESLDSTDEPPTD
jgi:hypothetical protein